MLFLISDFLGSGYTNDLSIANRKHDVIAIKVTDQRESKFEDFGIIEFEDAETGEVITIDTADAAFRRQFAEKTAGLTDELERSLLRMNVDFIKLTTGHDYILPLSTFFKQRARRLR